MQIFGGNAFLSKQQTDEQLFYMETKPMRTLKKIHKKKIVLWDYRPLPWKHDIDNDGFFLACEDFGEGFDNSPPALFFFFFLSGDRLAHTNFNFLGQDQSAVAQRAETTVAECSWTSCVWAHFPYRSPHYISTALSAHSDFVELKVCACLGVTCQLHFRQNDRGLSRATVVTRG